MSTSADSSQDEVVEDPAEVESVETDATDYGDTLDVFESIGEDTEESEPSTDSDDSLPETTDEDTSSLAVEFPEHLLIDSGLSVEQARSQFSSPEELQKAIDAYDRQMLSSSPQGNAQTPPGDMADPYTLPPVKLPEEFADDETTRIAQAILDQVSGHYAPLLQQRDQLLATIFAERQQQQREGYKNEFESGIEKLGEDWAPVFGKGDGRQLPENSPLIQNRIALDRYVAAMAQNRAAQGLPPLSTFDLQRRAARAAFPQHHDATVVKSVQGKKQTRRSQFTTPPTAVNGQPRSRDQKAVAVAEEMARKFKIPLANAGTDEDFG